ncbi:hypothetical protein [Variovorax sp. UC74_104]|uniref:hypothetical protein n=1 Tax=Variovorax sp. UC74_104 TaxID=3374555 RepID=UPI003491C249
MNAAAQLSMFEPEGAEAVNLLRSHLAEAKRHRDRVEYFEVLRMPGAARRETVMAEQAEASAFVLAVLLDLEAEAGL